MRRNAILLFLILIPLLALAVDFHPEAQEQLEKENFWAGMVFTNDERYSVTSVRAWYNHPPETLFLYLSDTNLYVKVHKNYNDSRALNRKVFEGIMLKRPDSVEAVLSAIGNHQVESFANRKPGQHWKSYAFLNFNLPWPLANRWMVQEIMVDESRASEGYYRFDYETKIGNFKALKGYWELVPIKDKPGWTEYRAQYISNPGIPIPKFVAEKAAIISIRKDYEENKAVLTKQE